MFHVISTAQVKEALRDFKSFGPSMSWVFAAAASVRVIDDVRVHVVPCADAENAYGWTQTAEECNSGDLIVWGSTVAVMDRAWPVTVRGNDDAFHHLGEGLTWETFEGGKYAAAVAVAQKLNLVRH